MFYGGVINPGKPVPLVPHPEGWALHLSQASLPASVKEKSRVSLLIKVQGEEPVVLCTLSAGVSDTVLLVSVLLCCRQVTQRSSNCAASTDNIPHLASDVELPSYHKALCLVCCSMHVISLWQPLTASATLLALHLLLPCRFPLLLLPPLLLLQSLHLLPFGILFPPAGPVHC
jgi:hypothetical protein